MKYLITRGTSWLKLNDWRILQLASEPNLLTAVRTAQLSRWLTPHEAARVAFRLHPGGEFYMWDEVNYVPGPGLVEHKAVRVVGTVDANGVWAVAK